MIDEVRTFLHSAHVNLRQFANQRASFTAAVVIDSN